MRVEVAYAGQDAQAVLELEAPPGATVEQVIRRSGVLEHFPEIDLAVNRVGIHGRLARLPEPVAEGDRVEIYRPLRVDPKEARRRRARPRAP